MRLVAAGDENLAEARARPSQLRSTEPPRSDTASPEPKASGSKTWGTAAKGCLGALAGLRREVGQFLAEAQSLRKELQYPRPKEVLKLTVIALIATAVLISVVNGLDLLFYKLLGERQLRKWGLLSA